METKFRNLVIFLLKVLSVIFLLSAVVSFVTSVIYNAINYDEGVGNLLLYIFANLGVTLFLRMVMAVFFFAFAMFIEEWFKTE
jgi:hypothetical protein